MLATLTSFHAGPLPGEPAGATFARVDGVRLHYQATGQGPPALLLHGFAASLEMWREVIPAVALHHQALALDLKGFGWSGRPAGDYSVDAQAALALGLLDQLGVREATLVGHSWGAAVALAMALRAPGRVRGLALYAPCVYQDQVLPLLPWTLVGDLGASFFATWYASAPRFRLSLAFHDSRLVTAGLVEEFRQSLARPGSAAAALASLRALDLAAQQERYSSLGLPARIFWGADDLLLPPAAGRRLERDLGARLTLYPRCGHFPMLEARASHRDLLAFLGGHA